MVTLGVIPIRMSRTVVLVVDWAGIRRRRKEQGQLSLEVDCGWTAGGPRHEAKP